ncbi:MAG: DNA polymerase-4 [Litorivivens sp.]|jgi:DNA polymerase-4
MEESARKIIHVDMDAFFASVEQRDNPDIQGKPVAVGGSHARGVIAAASYEARKFGVRSAMPSVTASRLCPHLIFVPHRFEIYKEVSQQIREIFHSYTDLVEPLSLDEAFLDVTRNKLDLPSATLIAHRIRKEIFERTQLTASAGVSVNKFLAKVASDVNKPDGLTLIAPHQIDDFIANLPIKLFFGVGKVTAEKMTSYGIVKGADLQKYTRPELVRMFGKAGAYYFSICRGIDHRPVRSSRNPKSVSAETTFVSDLTDLNHMVDQIKKLSAEVARRLDKQDLLGKTISIKFRDSEFNTFSRNKTIADYTAAEDVITAVAIELIKNADLEKPVRLLGVGVSKLNLPEANEFGQLTLDF